MRRKKESYERPPVSPWIGSPTFLFTWMSPNGCLQERLSERLHWALEHGVGPFFRFGGSEQATPPMISKRFFEEFVIGYEAPPWKMVREAGGIVWVHCHIGTSEVTVSAVDDHLRENIIAYFETAARHARFEPDRNGFL